MFVKQERYILFRKKYPIQPRWLVNLFGIIISLTAVIVFDLFVPTSLYLLDFIIFIIIFGAIRNYYAFVKVHDDNHISTWGTQYIFPIEFHIDDIAVIDPTWKTYIWGKYLKLTVTLKNGKTRDLYVADYDEFLKLMHERNPKIQIMPVPPMY